MLAVGLTPNQRWVKRLASLKNVLCLMLKLTFSHNGQIPYWGYDYLRHRQA